MKGKAVWFDVDVPGAVVGVPRVVEGPQLGLAALNPQPSINKTKISF